MWNWYSGDGTAPPGSAAPAAGTMSMADLSEQLAQTQQLVVQLKDLIREKDNDLRKKDQQLKEEKESSESKVSKAKLQSKAKIASLTSQLEELKKQLASPQAKKPDGKKGSGEGEQENPSANRGKILVLRKRVEELESQLTSKNVELQKKEAELEAQRLRGSEMDVMLAAKEKKLVEKEAYIIDLQMSAAGNLSAGKAVESDVKTPITAPDSSQDLQILIQNLTRKVGDSEEKYSLLHEQTESLKALLNKEKSQFQEKEAMYTENIRVYQNMILEKEKEMKDLSLKHDQEIFKLAAKSDATADLHQLLKALKQKLHEEEEVLSGKNQVIDVLQKELDNKDQQIAEMNEKCRRLASEKDNLQSKLEAEKHIMRAQFRDMMEKHEAEVQTLQDRHSQTLQEEREKHETEVQEKSLTIQQLQAQLQGLASPGEVRAAPADTTQKEVLQLQGEIKVKTEEASKSEAKFLKLKAWSKSRIRQLEEELKITEMKNQEQSQLSVRIAELEEENKHLELKLESVADLQALNEQLLAKLVVYEDQQRKLQADLEHVTKRADSQTSESGSVDEMQHQLLEWSEMNAESDIPPEQEREEQSVMALRMAQIEEEREAMDSGQVELEEELSVARGLGKLRTAQRKDSRGATKLQEEFDYSGSSFAEPSLVMESGDSPEGENMGGWWPEYGSPNSGLRVVVEELELERNQLQEQIMTLEERCQELEDRMQLQARIESLQVTFDVDEDSLPSLQTENERLQSQMSQARQIQNQEAEKHLDLIATLTEQLKSLTNRNAFLENAVVEKEQTILEGVSKLEQLGGVRKTLQEKEAQNKELWEKLDQCENQLEEVTMKHKKLEAENSALKLTNSELTEKLSAFKERVLLQDSSLEKLQVDLDQTNEDLDRLNSSHLEERSQLIFDLQRCEREVDVLKELMQEKDKEMSSLSLTLTEYSEQISLLKESIDFKDGQMREMSDAFIKAEREHHLLKEAQTMGVQETSSKISSLSEQLSEMELELNNFKSLNEVKTKEVEELLGQIRENGITIRNLRQEIQTQSATHNNHLTECSTQIASLKDQMNASFERLNETELKYKKEIESLKLQLEADDSEKARIADLLEERSKKEQNYEQELKTTKEQYNHLVSNMSKKEEAIEQLSNQLSEQKGLCDKLNKELANSQHELSTLKKKFEELELERENQIKTLQEKTQELQKEMVEKSEAAKTLSSEKEQLQAQYEMLKTSIVDKESSIQHQLNFVEELGKKVQGLENHNQNLCSEKDNLLMQVSQKDSEISHLNLTLKDVQTKLAEVERQLSEEHTNMTNLMGDKEKLLAKIDQISLETKQNNSAFAAQIEEKEKERLSLMDQLHQEQEISRKLQNQMQSLEKDLQEVQENLHEKVSSLEATNADHNKACENLKQHQEKNELLQKQVDELSANVEKSRKELEEKDLLLATQRAQLEEMTSNLEKLRNEEQSLKATNGKLTENTNGLKNVISKLHEDLNGKIAELTTLKEKLEIRNKEIEKLTHDRDSSLLSVSNLDSQCQAFQSQLIQSQAAADVLTQQVNLLTSEREKFNSDIKLLNTDLSSKSQEINVLSSHLSQQGHTILSLKDQVDTIQLEKQTLLRNIGEKDALLLQKEELIQQAEKKLEGEGVYLQTISTLQNELQNSRSECALQQQKVSDQELEMQKLMQQMQLFKDKSEEAGLLKTQLSEHMEIISGLHFEVKNLKDNVDQLNDALTKKDECLKEKVDSYINLKARLSDLQDSLEEHQRNIDALTVQNTQYKNSLSDNESALKNSLLDCSELKQKLIDQEAQCSMLTKQITELEEVCRKQNSELNELRVATKEQETLLLGKQEFLNTELDKQIQLVAHLQERVLELDNTNKDLQLSIIDKESAAQNLQDKYTSLHDHKQELAESLTKKEAETSKLLISLEERDAKLQVLESNIQAFTTEVNLLREELDKGNSNARSISDTLKMKDDLIAEHQKAAEVLRAELVKLNKEYQDAKTQFNVLMQEKAENVLLAQNLQEKCTSQNQQIDNLKQDLDRLSSELLQGRNAAEAEQEDLQQQLEALKQEKLHLEKIMQASQVEQDASLTLLQNQLMEKAETVKELKEKLENQVKESKMRTSSDAEALRQMKASNADLQKQVSGHAEEINALKVYIETVERKFSELQQKSEKELQRVNEQNMVLIEQNSCLDDMLKSKQNEVQSLLRDISFVEEQLCVLCDEKTSEWDSGTQEISYCGKVETLSSMLSKALEYKSEVAKSKMVLEAKDQDLEHKSQAILTFEKEIKDLQAEMQKNKEEKLGSDYALGELATLKETLDEQRILLKEKEEVLVQMSSHVATLQEELKLTKEDLQKIQFSLSEEKAKVLELIEENKVNNSATENQNKQLSQQRELISSLTDQVKEKDSSLIQVMESMSNETVRLSDEKNALSTELQNLWAERSSHLLQISELSEKLETCQLKLQQSEQIVVDKEKFLCNLSNEKDLQLEKFNKERENLKRKLQAALVIRKDLMQKLEKLEESKKEELNAQQLKLSELERTMEGLNCRLGTVIGENGDLQTCIDAAKQELLRREGNTNELSRVLSEKESVLVELQNEVTKLQHSFTEKDGLCQEYFKTIQEKEQSFSQVKNTLKEKLKTLEEENCHLVESLESLKSCLEKAQGNLDSPITNQSISTNQAPGTSVSVTSECSSAESSFALSENSIVHNNVHASLLCSQGNVESKDKHATLLESLSRSVKDFELLQRAHVEVQLAYKTKCAEYEQQREQTLALENQIDAQQEILIHKESELTLKDKEMDQLQQKLEKVSHKLQESTEYEGLISEFKSSILEKDEQLLKMSSEHKQLLSEGELLKEEFLKLSRDLEQKQEEICYLKNTIDSRSMEVKQYESMAENMESEIAVLQKEVEESRKMNESVQLTIQQLANERDVHIQVCQANQGEIAKLRNDLELKVLQLLEKDKEVSDLKGTLQLNMQTSEEKIQVLRNKIQAHKEEENRLQADYEQVKEELEKCLSKLEKAHVEISDFRTKLLDSRKEEEMIVARSPPISCDADLSQAVPETKHTLQGTRDYIQQTCEDCVNKKIVIEELEKQVMKANKEMENLTKEHERKISEEHSSKEQVQRKLQAALVSRKDLLKENKALKQAVESLNIQADGLKHSLEEIQEKHCSEVSLFTNKSKDLLVENERLLLENENLSAACESLKSTMENILQEKEAFSYQLNSLKDSQTDELTGWKAKHGELNKEYESLLQAYENISDEIDKMRQVIDLTKREKHEVLIQLNDLQSENEELLRQIGETGDEISQLSAALQSKDKELMELKLKADGVTDITEKASKYDEIIKMNQQLLEEKSNLFETCENLKLCLENKEKENNSLFVIKTALDKLQMDMSMYKSDMEIKINEMSSENEVLLKKVTELSIKVQETQESLIETETERDNLSEKLSSSEVLLNHEKDTVLKLESDMHNIQLENMNLEEKVKILKDDKAILLEEIENVQEQYCTVKNEKETMETELLKAVKNNSLLSDKFKSLQAQTNVLSQQVEYLRTEKNNIVKEREEHQLQVLRDLEEKVKSAQDDNRGTKCKSKELQELLREKQQEINQLQKDSIRFQELILDHEGSIKESSSQNEILKKELEGASAQLAQVRKEVSSLNKELTDKKHLLECANIQITKLTTEFRDINDKWIVDNQAQERPSKKDNQGFGTKVDSNGIEHTTEFLDSILRSEDEALSKLKSEQISEQPVIESPREDLKAVQSVLSKKEQEFQQLKLECERLRADIQKQVTISEHMKEIINNKDKEISLLISSNEGGISNYLEQIQSQYRKQGEEYEHRLTNIYAQKEKSDMECRKLEKELRDLQNAYDKAVSDKLLLSKEIEAFRKSMSSLQTDRDQLYSELQNIHQHSESTLNQKDNVIISTSAENSALKTELRNILNRVDDLNAENAMLGAQLIRYREDLNQVLSLKDHQLRELLRQKLDHIKSLEQEKCDLEKQQRDMQNANVALQSSAEALDQENLKLLAKVKDQEDLIASLNKEKILFESRKKESSSFAEQMKNLENKYNQNIETLGPNSLQLGSESNKESEKSEKTYSDILLENKDLRSQNESFGKAMAALQNNRDSLIDDFKELQWRYSSELKAEKIRGDDLERQLRDFKFQLYNLLKRNGLLDKTLLVAENQITLDQLVAEIDSLCNLLANRESEITRLSTECAAYVQQVDAFSKAMASLQHDRERLLQQLKEPALVREAKQGTASGRLPLEVTESGHLSGPPPDKLTQVTELTSGSAAKAQKMRTRVQDLERLLNEARSALEKLEKEVTGYQYELAELRSEKNFLLAEVQALRLNFNTAVAEKTRLSAGGKKYQETAKLGNVSQEAKGVENVEETVPFPDKTETLPEEKEPSRQEVQRYIQAIQHRDVIIQQINAKAMESMQMNSALSAQMKTVSQALEEMHTKYILLQNQYYKVQRDLETPQGTNQNDILTEVPPGAPQERASVLVEIDNAELADLRRRLVESEVSHEATQQELSQVSERLAEERGRREAAEEALLLTQQHKRLETASSSRDYEFSLQMESDDEREALIIDPAQNVMMRKIKGGTLSIRRWLRGRSLYCSKLLTSRSKSRYLFLTYLLGLHILILMCLAGVL
ncbi:golgin subfamily B member 1-like isoform X2 [Hyperolius riggenbachi]|uniref:golgin subfamily B member 1-like isoform X2 n=1 Tax=Hyperolius riggenbachi TaxID=752182 RepID=UPI0035A27507